MKNRLVLLLLPLTLFFPVFTAQAGDVQLPRTGLTSCYNTSGTVIDCTTLGQTQDAALKVGVPWDPVSRFTASGNGTVTDNLTGLIWLQNANCFGNQTWQSALNSANTLVGNNNSQCGLNDGSIAGDWRLPNIEELRSLVDLQRKNPSLPTGHPFSNVQSGTSYDQSIRYWSSSNFYNNSIGAWTLEMYFGISQAINKTSGCYVWPVRGGHLDPLKIVPPKPIATFLSENLPDGSYHVGATTKAWRFKSGETPITGLKAQVVSTDTGLGITVSEITDIGPTHNGNIPANTEFLVYLPINPQHIGTDVKSSYWKFVDGAGQIVTISNSKTGQFWLKISTNRSPEFSQLQLMSVSGQSGVQVSLPILASDPDGDSLTYSVISGGGSVVSGSWQGKPAMLYQHTFPASAQTVYPIKIGVNDGHGGTAEFTIQAVIAPDGKIKEFYKDTLYPAGGNPSTTCDLATSPPTFTPNMDQYQAIHHLTMKGILIGTADKLEPTKRNYDGCSVASQAEVLATLMKSAIVRGVPKNLALDVDPRWLSNLVVTNVNAEIYKNYSWAAPYVLKAEELGMIPSADTFDPSADAKREWVATIVAKLLDLNTPMDAVDQTTFLFADSSDFTSTAANTEALAVAYFGYMVADYGSSVYFRPNETFTRADMAIVASKILRTPTADAIETTGLTLQTFYGKQMLSTNHGQDFNVTGITNLAAFLTVVDSNGYVSESIIHPSLYTSVKIIRPGLDVVGSTLITNLAGSPILVPTATPNITFSEERSIVAVLESTDNPVRNVVRLNYGVFFPDADNDGVRDDLDLWPSDPLYSFDTNANGIPDNADALWGLTNRSGSDQIRISGLVTTLLEAVFSGKYAQMMADPTPPSVVSTTPIAGSLDVSTTDTHNLSVMFSRELDLSTVSSTTVSLINVTTSSAVPGTITYSLGRITFTPSSALAYASDYQLSLSTGLNDLAGHALVNSYQLTFQTESMNFPPTGNLSINNGAQYTNNPNVNLSIFATDPHGITEMCLSLTPTCSVWMAYSATPLFFLENGNGISNVYVWFKDGKGLVNDTYAATASIVLDTSPPMLSLSMLSDGAVTTENLVNVAGYAKDTGTGLQMVTVNGIPVEVNAVNGLFSYPLPLTSTSATITVIAEDLAGNQSSATRTINRDVTAPALTITSPADNGTTSVALMTINGTVEAGATVSVSLNGGAPVAAQVTDTSYTAQVTLISTFTANTIQITATGLSGKSSSAKRTIRYSHTRWTMEVIDPHQDVLSTAGSYLLKGRVADVVNSPVTISISNGTDIYTPTVTDGTFEQLVTMPTYGIHAFTVTGTDSLGNKISNTRIFNRLDLEPPVITDFSMPATYNALEVPLTFSVNNVGDATGWCLIYGVATVANSCSWSSTAPVSYKFVSQGTKSLTAFVKDAAGNISTPVTTSVAISFPVTLSVTVNNAVGAGGTVTSSPQGTNPDGVSCTSGTCSTMYPYHTVVSLLPTPNDISVFGGWVGNCYVSGVCGLTMTVSKNVTANFVLAPKAMIGANSYSSLAAAYLAASPGDIILLLDSEMPDAGLDINEELAHGKNVTLKGGYKADYSDTSGLPTYLKGRLNISSGVVRIENVKIRP